MKSTATGHQEGPKQVPDISVIVSAHNESDLIFTALRSVESARLAALERNVSVQVIVVMDRPDNDTAFYVDQFGGSLEKMRVDFGDAGRSRMHAWSRSSGRYITFLDGDDVMDSDWLWRATAFMDSQPDPEKVIARSEIMLGYGENYFGRIQVESVDDILFHPLNLLSTWYFGINFIASRKMLEAIPFETYDKDHGFWSEDWHWSCEAISTGIVQLSVPHTVYFYRQRANSLNETRGLTIRPTRLFSRPENWESPSLKNPILSILPNQAGAIDHVIERPAPDWLLKTVDRHLSIDFGFYELKQRLSDLRLTTPKYSSAFSHVYDIIFRKLFDANINTIIVIEQQNWNALSVINGLGAKLRDSASIAFLDLTSGPNKVSNSLTASAFCHVPLVKTAQEFDLSHHDVERLITRIFLELKPKDIIVVGSPTLDEIIARTGLGFQHYGIHTTRIDLADYPFVEDATFCREFPVLRRCATRYTHHICKSIALAEWLKQYAGLTDKAVIGAGLPTDGVVSVMNSLIDAAIRSEAPSKASKARLQNFESRSDASDISLCVLAHQEGSVLAVTLENIRQNVAAARAKGIRVDVLLLGDDMDQLTEEIVAREIERGTFSAVKAVKTREVGENRNSILKMAKGKYIAWQDADDLQSSNWLIRAFEMAEKHSGRMVLHPEICVYFGDRKEWFYHASIDAGESVPGNLLMTNLWTSASFVNRAVYRDIPFQNVSKASGFGHEDWHWNCEALAAGWSHRVVPRTSHYLRVVLGRGVSQSVNRERRSMRPTALFRPGKKIEFYSGSRAEFKTHD